jgi:hypothetical protein
MMPAALLRALRLGGAALLLGLAGLAATSLVVPYGDRVEAGGMIAAYGNDAVILATEGQRYYVLVSPATIVRDGDQPASLSALRPGRLAVVLGATERIDRTVRATTIMVWGGADRAPGPDVNPVIPPRTVPATTSLGGSAGRATDPRSMPGTATTR